jgi:hypothetical protein
MPTICYIDGYRFFFFSNEGFEPMHVHIDKAGSLAKFWLNDLSLASNYGFNAAELNKLRKLVEINRELFVIKWNEYFNR